jgi:DNA recombination protein RmuC
MFLFAIGVIFFIKRELRRGSSYDSINYLKQDIEAMRKDVGDGLWRAVEGVQKQSRESSQLIKGVTEELVKLGESQKQVLNVTDQLRNLQEMLKNPKQRGMIGEFYLETLLQNVLPSGIYQTQYSFSDGAVVDAVIFLKDQLIIPIDSKFSLENYNRISEAKDDYEKERLEKAFISDLKNRIVETAKYIQPKEGTTDFAFMFIPHEAIYYDLLVNKIGPITQDTENLLQLAVRKYKVIIVSPTSFLAYLQTVLQGLKAMKIEESAQLILKRVDELSKHLSTYQKSMDSLGKSMGAAVNHYNRAVGQFHRIDKDLYNISGKSIDSDVEKISSPKNRDEID